MIFNSDLVKVTTDAMEFPFPVVDIKKKTGMKIKITATLAKINDAGKFKGTETIEIDRKELINIANKLVEWVVDLEEAYDKPSRMKSVKKVFHDKLYAAAGNIDVEAEEPE